MRRCRREQREQGKSKHAVQVGGGGPRIVGGPNMKRREEQAQMGKEVRGGLEADRGGRGAKQEVPMANIEAGQKLVERLTRRVQQPDDMA